VAATPPDDVEPNTLGLVGISNLLGLFTGVEELFLTENDGYWQYHSGVYEVWQQGDDRDLWTYTPVLEIDALANEDVFTSM
jgi:hypothetical protein